MSETNPYAFFETSSSPMQLPPDHRPDEVYEPQLPIRLLLVRNDRDDYLSRVDLTITDETLTIIERNTHVFARTDAARSITLKGMKLLLALPSGEKRIFFFSDDPDLPLLLARLEVWLDAKLINNPHEAKRCAIEYLKTRCYRPLGRLLWIGMCISLILLILMIGFLMWVVSLPNPDEGTGDDDNPILLAIPLFHILTLNFFIAISGIFYLLHRVVGSIFGVIFHVMLIFFSMLTLNILGVIWGLVVCVRCFFIHFKYKRLLAKIAAVKIDEESKY